MNSIDLNSGVIPGYYNPRAQQLGGGIIPEGYEINDPTQVPMYPGDTERVMGQPSKQLKDDLNQTHSMLNEIKQKIAEMPIKSFTQNQAAPYQHADEIPTHRSHPQGIELKNGGAVIPITIELTIKLNVQQ